MTSTISKTGHVSQEDMRAMMTRLWPLNRSITGDGVRASLDILEETMALERTEIPSGTQCFDWAVPPEWNVREAWVEDLAGNRVIDWAVNNLSLVSYSMPFSGEVSREELLAHLHTDPDRPDAIPYRTSYYKEEWGFCLEHNRLPELTDERYRVLVDSELKDGSLTIAEAVVPGVREEEILITSYLCHPSMANNELSGPVALWAAYTALAAGEPPQCTVRFVFHPETIGAISYLSIKHEYLKERVVAGLCVSMVGNDAPLIYKHSRHPENIGNRVASNLFPRIFDGCDIRPYSPVGGADLRQYCSIGIDLPVGFFGRAMGGSYSEYHCSDDTIERLSFQRMEETVTAILSFIQGVGMNESYVNTMPCCEPQLGRRGLYPQMGGKLASQEVKRYKMLLGLGDGGHDLVAVAEELGEPVVNLEEAVAALVQAELLRKA